MQKSTSYSRPSNGPYFLNSQIDTGFRASASAQLGNADRQSLTTSIAYMVNRWITPRDYKDEL